MPHFIDTPAAGRLAIMPAPVKADLARIRAAGVDCVVSLLTEGEAERLDLLDEAARCRRHGMDFVAYPIRDFAVPESLALAGALVGSIADQVSGGDTVAVHCRAGIGRSGMITSAVLVALGLAPEDAMAAVSAARGCHVPETDAQRDWVRRFAAYAAEAPAAG